MCVCIFWNNRMTDMCIIHVCSQPLAGSSSGLLDLLLHRHALVHLVQQHLINAWDRDHLHEIIGKFMGFTSRIDRDTKWIFPHSWPKKNTSWIVENCEIQK